MMRAVITATIAVTSAASLALGASAQTSPPVAPAPSDEVSLHGFGDSDKSCQEWTDGCRTCTRPESGDALCSNIGIACQPKPIFCARRAEEKKAEEKKPDEKK